MLGYISNLPGGSATIARVYPYLYILSGSYLLYNN